MELLIERLKSIEPDLIIRCENGQVNAVKLLLMTASSPFKTMLTAFKEGAENIISLPEEKVSTVHAFVNYVQYGELPSDLEILCMLSLLLDRYTVGQNPIVNAIADAVDSPNDAIMVYTVCTAECHKEIRMNACKALFISVLHGDHHKCFSCNNKMSIICKTCERNRDSGGEPCKHGHRYGADFKCGCTPSKKFANNQALIADIEWSSYDASVIGAMTLEYFNNCWKDSQLNKMVHRDGYEAHLIGEYQSPPPFMERPKRVSMPNRVQSIPLMRQIADDFANDM